MRLKITRRGFEIIPEDNMNDESDIAFIEDVLGLKKAGDSVSCKRVNAIGLSYIAYLEIKKEN